MPADLRRISDIEPPATASPETHQTRARCWPRWPRALFAARAACAIACCAHKPRFPRALAAARCCCVHVCVAARAAGSMCCWPRAARAAACAAGPSLLKFPASIVCARFPVMMLRLLDHDPPPPLLLDHDPSPPRLLDHELSPMIFQVMTQDMFSEAPLCFGASSTSVDEHDNDADENSDEIYIDSIFPECKDVDECILNTANSIGLKEIPRYEVKMGEQCNWIKKAQESFHPVEFGTAMSVGVDIDPQVIKSAHQNAALNNIGPKKMKLHLVPDRTFPSSMNERVDGIVEYLSSHKIRGISETEEYDVVIANILLNPLLQLADHIVSYAKPGAVVGISGILSEQVTSLLRC
ncbi:Ribosomal protein L11 methyltransferase-like protein [Citrus sinensis]|uniref:Ribosomal protein L11 methyltransferase-like protein n=1 Tax=Citrus sinensis TaxID=2711 RepID=A0ACB8I0L8_CITSI|nr:Ribosomal protein L11 methyltransferase-like protein [Citrus sinensis]